MRADAGHPAEPARPSPGAAGELDDRATRRRSRPGRLDRGDPDHGHHPPHMERRRTRRRHHLAQRPRRHLATPPTSPVGGLKIGHAPTPRPARRGTTRIRAPGVPLATKGPRAGGCIEQQCSGRPAQVMTFSGTNPGLRRYPRSTDDSWCGHAVETPLQRPTRRQTHLLDLGALLRPLQDRHSGRSPGPTSLNTE